MDNDLKWLDEIVSYLAVIESVKKETKEALLYYRKEKILSDYSQFLGSIFRFIDLLSFRCLDFPQFFNVEPTKEEREYWESKNERFFVFNGMWEYLGKRLAVFVDDYGQQMVVRYTKRNGEIEDIGNGTYCIDSGNCASIINNYIFKDLEDEMKEYADSLEK